LVGAAAITTLAPRALQRRPDLSTSRRRWYLDQPDPSQSSTAVRAAVTPSPQRRRDTDEHIEARQPKPKGTEVDVRVAEEVGPG